MKHNYIIIFLSDFIQYNIYNQLFTKLFLYIYELCGILLANFQKSTNKHKTGNRQSHSKIKIVTL